MVEASEGDSMPPAEDEKPSLPASASERLSRMAALSSSATKIVTSWIVALVAFAFFGIAQVYWQVGRDRGELEDLERQINALRKEAIPNARVRLNEAMQRWRGWGAGGERSVSAEAKAVRRRAAATPRERPAEAASAAVGKVMSAPAGGPCELLEAWVERTPPRAGFEARRDARAECRYIESKERELQALKAERKSLVEARREIPLKTPLFETQVVSFLSPIAALGLMFMAIYYIDHKRRELLTLYVETWKLAVGSMGSEGQAAITRFNIAVRERFGTAPLWLLPFPMVRGLPPGLRVDDALGRDARGAHAWLLSVAAVAGVATFAGALFVAAVDNNLAAFHRPIDGTRPGFEVDLHYLAMLSLACLVVFIAATALLPWAPPAARQSRSLARRGALLMLPIAYLAVIPLSALMTGRSHHVLSVLPSRLRKLATLVAAKTPRLRSGMRWQGRWRAASEMQPSQSVAGFVERLEARPPTHRHRLRRHRLTYVVRDRVHGLRWLAPPGGARSAMVPVKSVQLDEVMDWMASVSGGTVKAVPRVQLLAKGVSVQFEAAALDLLGSSDARRVDKSIALLETAIGYLERQADLELERKYHRDIGRRGGAIAVSTPRKARSGSVAAPASTAQLIDLEGTRSALRLYDLVAVIALQNGKKPNLVGLAKRLEDRLSAWAKSPHHVFGVAALSSTAASGPATKHSPCERRKRTRLAPPDVESGYLVRQLQQRLVRWQADDSRWHQKWSTQGRRWGKRLDNSVRSRRAKVQACAHRGASATVPGRPGSSK